MKKGHVQAYFDIGGSWCGSSRARAPITVGDIERLTLEELRTKLGGRPLCKNCGRHLRGHFFWLKARTHTQEARDAMAKVDQLLELEAH